ncbi:MAG: DNRLRE domain-containing protein [Candidatus Latescibacteria bacterium]|nr:DNRLRE domain-containing protein [Candidatus Latescibacterota bacterium]
MSRILPYCCALALLLGSRAAIAEEVFLVPTKDNTLFESATGSLGNGAGAYIFVGKTGEGKIRRGLLAFDIAGSVPAGATITRAALTLHMSKTTAGPAEVSLHRVLADWGEGTSDAAAQEGKGAPATPGDATWLHTTFDAATWAAPGGDFAPEPSATTSVNAVGSYTWESPQLAAEAQAWLADPAGNFGWMIAGGESANSTAKRFDSREQADQNNWPTLSITYDATAVAPSTWGAVKEDSR